MNPHLSLWLGKPQEHHSISTWAFFPWERHARCCRSDRRQLLNLTLKINMTEWLTTFPSWHGSTWRSSRDSLRTLPQKRTSMMLCVPFCCFRMQVKLHLLLLFCLFFCETIIQIICITAPQILYMYYWKTPIRQNIRLLIKSHAEIWRLNWFKNTPWITTACNSYDDVML